LAPMVVFVPSRGRPGNIAQLAESWQETFSWYADLLVALDEDDPALPEYLALDVWNGTWASNVVGPRRRLGPTLNWLAESFPDYDAIGFMGDDHRPRTPRWDEMVCKVLDGMGAAIVYGDDLLQHERLPTAVFMTSNIPAALGWMCPPGMVHLYLDDAWKALGEGMGRLRYLPNVVIEHLHPTAGKAPMDERYAEVNSAEQYASDGAVFEEFKRAGLPAALEKLHTAGLC